MKLKVYELAKKYNKSNQEIKDILLNLGLKTKSHLTVIPPIFIEKFEDQIEKNSKKSISKPQAVLRKRKVAVEKENKNEEKNIKKVKDTKIKEKNEVKSKEDHKEKKKTLDSKKSDEKKKSRVKVSSKKIKKDEDQKESVKKNDDKGFTVVSTDAKKGKKKSDSLEDKKSKKKEKEKAVLLDKIRTTHDKSVSRKQNKKKKREALIKDKEKEQETLLEERIIRCKDEVTVKELADKIGVNPTEIVKYLFLKGEAYGINNFIPMHVIEDVAIQYNVLVEREKEIEKYKDVRKIVVTEGKERPPVITIMGHVDHGKTSLLDKIKSTKVVDNEAGGITQKISAYQVTVNGKKITFIDTPGHEAFMEMRARGAIVTDIAVLVVAADDGVMPQTVEAISHAKFAKIPIIVAINKIDKPNANVEKIKQELAEHNILSPAWGGNEEFVELSALTGQGIKDLLEIISVQAEIMDLKADYEAKARAVVIESRLDPHVGSLADIIIQNGRLKVGDPFIVGDIYGKVRYISNDQNKKVKYAEPSDPVQISGLSEVPEAGAILEVYTNEKEAKKETNRKKLESREKNSIYKTNLGDEEKELRVIIKSSSRGSLEAVKSSLLKIENSEIKLIIIQASTGGITKGDIKLAQASKAIILAFEVSLNSSLRKEAESLKIEILSYSIIYKLIEDIEDRMKNSMEAKLNDKYLGRAEVKEVFKVTKVGSIAGSLVVDGYISVNSKVKVFRENVLIYEGEIDSLKRFKDDVSKVEVSQECGIGIKNFNDIKQGDSIESYITEEIS